MEGTTEAKVTDMPFLGHTSQSGRYPRFLSQYLQGSQYPLTFRPSYSTGSIRRARLTASGFSQGVWLRWKMPSDTVELAAGSWAFTGLYDGVFVPFSRRRDS